MVADNTEPQQMLSGFARCETLMVPGIAPMTLGLKRPVITVQELRKQRAKREATGTGGKGTSKSSGMQQ
eukprot:5815375-Amphidinium_carterae.1